MSNISLLHHSLIFLLSVISIAIAKVGEVEMFELKSPAFADISAELAQAKPVLSEFLVDNSGNVLICFSFGYFQNH